MKSSPALAVQDGNAALPIVCSCLTPPNAERRWAHPELGSRSSHGTIEARRPLLLQLLARRRRIIPQRPLRLNLLPRHGKILPNLFLSLTEAHRLAVDYPAV